MRSSSALLVAESSGLSECLDRLAAQKRESRPLATYRLQFNREFRFEDARRLLPYLHALGITHCYASPILKARPASAHGYDITDHNAINPEIGSRQEFEDFVSRLKSLGMGLVLDIVPNHMGIGDGNNPWWQDVLEHGRTSEYAEFFDIDWAPFNPDLRDKVLLPILGDQYGEELESGRLRINYGNGSFFVDYYDKRLPLDPQTFPLIFEPLGDLGRRRSSSGEEKDIEELENILAGLRSLPFHQTTDPMLVEQRRQQWPPLRERLSRLSERSSPVRALIAEALEVCNGKASGPHAFDSLHRILEAQAYRLAHWRVSAEEINYRRFFDINDLVGLRMENPRVFAATHRLMRKLLAENCISGLRIDHPDGLFNPPQYFIRTQMLNAAAHCKGAEPVEPVSENGIEIEVQNIFGQHDWINRQAPLYVVVEKILEPGEHLPGHWPVDGTVGYDFANLVNGIFIDERNLKAFTNTYHRFVGGAVDVDTVIYESKKLIMSSALAGEVTVLTHMLAAICSTDRRARDFTRSALTGAIRDTIACFPVYRTYVDERGNVSELDRGYINQAIARAKRRNEAVSGAVFDFLRNILLLNSSRDSSSNDDARDRLYFALKFQQLTGPVMAKGLEDTACYVYNRFVSVNEVGGTPKSFGTSLEEFHRGNSIRAQHWPYSMLATSTHDTKRSEDVRARLNVISELPRHWSSQVMRWRGSNRSKKTVIGDGRSVPDYNEEYLLYQTLVGVWPLQNGEQKREEFIQRMQRYMNKAVHESKVNLSWVNDNPEYVAALEQFVGRLLTPGSRGKRNYFLRQMQDFVPRIAFFGAINSLAQAVLKITAPGVPDIYQGNELWDFSLVDPDNRRSVDFSLRERMLAELNSASKSNSPAEFCGELLQNYDDGRIKMWTTTRALCLRRDEPLLFQLGSYTALSGTGDKREHLVGFAREHEGRMAIVAVPRLACTLMRGELRPPLGEAWGRTELELPARLSSDFGRSLQIFQRAERRGRQ